MLSNQTIQKNNFFSKTSDANLNFSKKYKANEIIDDIYNILYEKEFSFILLTSSKNFLKNIEAQSDILFQKNITPNEYHSASFLKLIDKTKEKFLNKYNEEYSFLYENWKNYKNNRYDFLYLTHFRKHCNKCDKIAYHHCSSEKSGKLICIKKSHQILYYLCTECKKCLRNNYLNLYCKNCDEEYLSSDKNIEENNESLYPATWSKYHCFILKDEIMRCLNCKKYLYLIKPENKLVCLDKKCNFSVKPEKILWNCSQCGAEFLSSAKIYEDELFNIFRNDIKYIFLNKEIAKPKKLLYCCGKYLNNENFFHNMNCNGILYKGKFNNKDIIVCGKCGYNNYLNDFIWTCPYCKKEIKNSNNINEKRRSKNNSKNFDNNLKNNNDQFQNIRVNRKLEKIVDMSKKVKFVEKNDLEKKSIDFKKIIPFKSDIFNNSSNKNTCTSTYRSTKSNNNNCNNFIYVSYKKNSSTQLTNKNNNFLNKTNYLQSKNWKLLNKTISEEEINLIKKMSNTVVYSTFEKRNKMFKIKNRIRANSNDKQSKNDNNIINKNNKNIQIKDISRNKISQFKTDRKIKVKDLQIEDESIVNKLNFDSDIKTRPQNKTEVKNLKVNSNLKQNNYSLLRNTFCFYKKILNKKFYQFDSMRNFNNIDKNNINEIPQINSFFDSRDNSYNKLKYSQENSLKLNRYSQRIKQNYYKPKKSNNIIRIINNENSEVNFSNNSSKIYRTEVQIKLNSNNINRNSTLNNLVSNKSIHTNTLNNSDFKTMDIKESNKFILNKDNIKKNNEIFIRINVKQLNENLSKNIEKNKNNKETKQLKCRIHNKRILNYNKKKIKEKNNINNLSNSSNNHKKLSFQKSKENTNNNSKHSNSNNNSNNSISYIQVNRNKNKNFSFPNKNNNNNNNLLKAGLINHKNLVSSPDKLNDIIKNCTIPTFKDNDFVYIEPIGEGSYGTIFLVKELKTKNEYALKKIICQDLNDVLKLKNQLELHYSLKHENIMQIYKLQFKCLDFTTYGINILMEKASFDWGIEISKRAEKKNYYTEKELINIAKQIINALQFLQNKNIAHRDIKPENILIYPNNLYKVADLGEAKNMNNIKTKLYTLKGSEMYLSPALLEGLKENKNNIIHNVYKSDVFSLGYCFLYAMSLDIDVLEKIRKEELNNNKDNNKNQNYEMLYKFIDKDKYSEKFFQFIGKMVADNELERYDFIQLSKFLNDLE